MNFLDVNTTNLRNLYPTAMGNTVGMSGTANNQTSTAPAGTAAANSGAPDDVSQALSIGGQANPIIGALVFLAFLLALMFISKRVGTQGEFSNVKVSAFNVLVISLAAVIGVPVWKWIFTKVPVPAVTTWVHSV